MGLMPTAVGRKFTELQGWMNQYIAATADTVVLMVSGIPVTIKIKKIKYNDFTSWIHRK
jgi:adenosyl cobinamide kinase/adenosyl cobinamide phosphate guanylyltransferase